MSARPALIVIVTLHALVMAASPIRADPLPVGSEADSALPGAIAPDSLRAMMSPRPLSAKAGDDVVVEKGPGSVPVSLDPVVSVRNGTAAQLSRLAQALDRYAEAGLELPDLYIEFWPNESACKGRLGLFSPHTTPWRISICSPVDSVYEHELAHAWERATMTDARRQAFMEQLGYKVWSGSDAPWNERGMEGVALIVQQGLGGLPLPPVLGAKTRSAVEAFEMLTGRPSPRLVEWIGSDAVGPEEGRRPTSLARTRESAFR